MPRIALMLSEKVEMIEQKQKENIYIYVWGLITRFKRGKIPSVKKQ